MFGFKKNIKKTSPEASGHTNDMLDGIPARVQVYWREGGGIQRRRFAIGRHLIGTSKFAAIRLSEDSSNEICGALIVTDTEVRLKCTAPKPTMFVEGRKLSAGEEVLVGDVIQIAIGRVTVTVSVGIKSSKNSSSGSSGRREDASEMNDRLDADVSLLSSSNPFQAEANRLFRDIDGLRAFLSKRLLDQMNLAGIELSMVESPEVRESARLKLRKIIADLTFPRDYKLTAQDIERQVFDEVMGLGPLEPLLADEKVTEIMVNRRDQIYIERGGKLTLSPVHFSSDQALLNVIERIVSTVGRRIDQSSPIVDARLVDGSRVNAVIPPLALKGPNLTIRRFSKKPISVKKLVEFGALTPAMAKFLERLVCEHKNILISGGTGSGKTTLLNALSSFVPSNERIITIEDAAELQLQQEHVISLETRPPNLEGKGAVTIRDLVKNTLRMRPDRIIVGECRGGEALDMLQAMNTGHDGSMTTAHANAPEDMLRRLETMVMMAGMDLPLRAIREQIASAVTIVVQQTRRKTGKRLVTEVAWVRSINRETSEYEVITLFDRDRDDTPKQHDKNITKFWDEEELTGNAKEFLSELTATAVKSSDSKKVD